MPDRWTPIAPDAAAKRLVRIRAGGRCEYCGLAEDPQALPHTIDHVLARKHGGSDHEANLALACAHCNLHKGPNLSGVDPRTGEIVRLFHPRKDAWSEHFRDVGGEVAGLTPTGIATARTLNMNRGPRVLLRQNPR